MGFNSRDHTCISARDEYCSNGALLRLTLPCLSVRRVLPLHMAPPGNSHRLPGSAPPTLQPDVIDSAVGQFLDKHTGLTGSILCGYRVGAAFEALHAFVALNAVEAQPDFDTRLLYYAELLKTEMVRCIRAHPLA